MHRLALTYLIGAQDKELTSSVAVDQAQHTVHFTCMPCADTAPKAVFLMETDLRVDFSQDGAKSNPGLHQAVYPDGRILSMHLTSCV